MIFARMRKTLKKESKEVKLIHLNLWKKIYMHKVLKEFRILATKIIKIHELRRKNTLKRVLKGI